VIGILRRIDQLARTGGALELLQVEARIVRDLLPLFELSLALGFFPRAGVGVDEAMMGPVVDVCRWLRIVVLGAELGGESANGCQGDRGE
jgi:hypothetical protein